MSDGPLYAEVLVKVRTREDGDYYVDAPELARHVVGWVEGGLEDRDDITEVTTEVLSPKPESAAAELRESDDPAAHSLARHIASHGVPTVQAALRYLGMRLSFALVEEEPQEADSSSMSICITCQGVIGWVNCPTGGWWVHEQHPADDHDAQPAQCGCPAALLPTGKGPVEGCVVYGVHRVHRALSGRTWSDIDGIHPAEA